MCKSCTTRPCETGWTTCPKCLHLRGDQTARLRPLHGLEEAMVRAAREFAAAVVREDRRQCVLRSVLVDGVLTAARNGRDIAGVPKTGVGYDYNDVADELEACGVPFLTTFGVVHFRYRPLAFYYKAIFADAISAFEALELDDSISREDLVRAFKDVDVKRRKRRKYEREYARHRVVDVAVDRLRPFVRSTIECDARDAEYAEFALRLSGATIEVSRPAWSWSRGRHWIFITT